jgi:hypothetical protein
MPLPDPIGKKQEEADAKILKSREIPAKVMEKEAPFQVEEEIRQEISAAEHGGAYQQILSKVTATKATLSQDVVKADAENVYQRQDAEGQVQHLVDIAMQKGVYHAVKVAQHLESNYILDQFHDKLLSDELHSALLQKGLLKEM